MPKIKSVVRELKKSKPKIEIERKFKIKSPEVLTRFLYEIGPDAWTKKDLYQFWFIYKERTYRARRETIGNESKYFLELKTKVKGVACAKQERRFEIDERFFKKCEKNKQYEVTKSRYVISVEGEGYREMTIDVYFSEEGEVDEIIAEIEFDDLETADAFDPQIEGLEWEEVTDKFSCRKFAKLQSESRQTKERLENGSEG